MGTRTLVILGIQTDIDTMNGKMSDKASLVILFLVKNTETAAVRNKYTSFNRNMCSSY
jgi:hypothetical protein